jgi:hypothetical protein
MWEFDFRGERTLSSNVHPCVPKKTIGTLTSSILKSVHTSISLIIFYKLCSVATLGHPKSLSLENHGCIVALTPDLQRVSFYSVTDFLYHSSTTKLLLSLIFIKGSYPSSKASHLCRKSSLALWLLWRANSCMIATLICTSDESE